MPKNKTEQGSLNPKSIEQIENQGKATELGKQPERYQQIVDDLNEKFLISKQAKESIEKDFKEAAEEYENILEASTDGLANVKEPILFAVVQSKISDELSSSPQIIFKPQKPEDVKLVETTKAAFYSSTNKNAFNYNIYKCFLAKEIYGTGIGREEYVLKKRQVTDVTFKEKNKKIIKVEKERTVYDKDDAVLSYVDPRRFFPDAKAVDMETVSFSFELDDEDYDTFLMYASNDPTYIQSQVDLVLPSHGIEDVYPYNNPFELNEEKQKESAKRRVDRVTLVLYFDYIKDKFQIVANGILVKDIPNPYSHKELPYVRFVNYLELESFWGRSELRVIKQQIQEKNHYRNSMVDWGKININRPILLGQTDFEDEDIEYGPGAIWKVGDINQVKLLDLGDIPNGMFGMDSSFDNDIVAYSGIDYRSLVASGEETATKSAIKQEKSLKRIGMGLRLVDWTALEPFAKMRLANIQQFYTKKRARMISGTEVEEHRTIRVKDKVVIKDKEGNIRFVDEKGVYGFFEAKPEYISTQMDVEALTGSTMNASQEVDRQNLNAFLAAIAPFPQIMEQYDPKGMAEELAKKNNLDTTKIMTPAEQTADTDLEGPKSTSDVLADKGIVKPGQKAPKIPGEQGIPEETETPDLLAAMGVIQPPESEQPK